MGCQAAHATSKKPATLVRKVAGLFSQAATAPHAARSSRLRAHPVLQRLVGLAEARIIDMQPRELATVAWALGRLGRRPQELLLVLAGACARALASLQAPIGSASDRHWSVCTYCCVFIGGASEFNATMTGYSACSQ